MKPSSIFSFLRISTGFLYYSLILITIVVIGKSALTFSGNAVGNKSVFNYEVLAFGEKISKSEANYSPDSLLRYSNIPNRFRVEVESNSVLGYYSFISKLINLLFGIAIMWLFRRIFWEANLAEPFKKSIFRRLVILAVLFVISDVFHLANYLIVNNLLNRSVSALEFELITDVGDGIITGLVIYAIAIIYQRGLSIQEENALTV